MTWDRAAAPGNHSVFVVAVVVVFVDAWAIWFPWEMLAAKIRGVVSLLLVIAVPPIVQAPVGAVVVPCRVVPQVGFRLFVVVFLVLAVAAGDHGKTLTRMTRMTTNRKECHYRNFHCRNHSFPPFP